MKPRGAAVYIQDILTAIGKIEKYTEGMSLKTFREKEETFDAVVRNIEIIGEAVKRIPESVTSKYPHIAWRDAAGMRDVLIHDYPDIAIDIVWDTAKEHLPILKEQMREVKRDLENK